MPVANEIDVFSRHPSLLLSGIFGLFQVNNLDGLLLQCHRFKEREWWSQTFRFSSWVLIDWGSSSHLRKYVSVAQDSNNLKSSSLCIWWKVMNSLFDLKVENDLEANFCLQDLIERIWAIVDFSNLEDLRNVTMLVCGSDDPDLQRKVDLHDGNSI